nr:uncharacterized protein LOC109158421 [Ipomoea batatas]
MEGSSSSSLVCRVDVGIDTATNRLSFKTYLVDSDGGFMAAINGSLDCVLNHLMVEAMACKEALKWIKSRGVMEVCVQSDCLNLVQALVSDKIIRFYFSSKVNESISKLRTIG